MSAASAGRAHIIFDRRRSSREETVCGGGGISRAGRSAAGVARKSSPRRTKIRPQTTAAATLRATNHRFVETAELEPRAVRRITRHNMYLTITRYGRDWTGKGPSPIPNAAIRVRTYFQRYTVFRIHTLCAIYIYIVPCATCLQDRRGKNILVKKKKRSQVYAFLFFPAHGISRTITTVART